MVMCKVGELPSSNQSSKNNHKQKPELRQNDAMSAGVPSAANGTNGFTPITSTRASTSFVDNSNNPSGAAGRSCFVLPHLGTKKKKKTLRISSSAASTADQSSTGDPFQFQESDQQSLLSKDTKSRNGSSSSRVEWFVDTMPVVEEGKEIEISERVRVSDFETDKTFTSNYSTPTKSPTPSSVGSARPVTPSSSSSVEPARALLQFPTPQDRSHDARRMRTKSSGHMHAYHGELEPEGVRGQEATILTTGTGTSGGSPADVPLRSFDSSQSLGQRISQRQQQLQLQLGKAERKEEELLKQQHQQHDTPPRVVTPNQSEQQYQRYHRQDTHKSAMPGTYLSSARHREESFSSFSEMVENNRAEILVQEDVLQDPFPSDRSREQTRQRRKTPPDPSANFATGAMAAVQEEHGHDSADPPPRAQRAGLQTGVKSQPRSPGPTPPTDVSTESSKSGFRQSAPVNVDDSSFEDPMEHIEGIHAMAMEHVMRGEYDMALEAFTEVLKVYLEQYGRAHPLTASAYHNLGTVHTKRAGLLSDDTLHQRHCREQALLCFQAAARSARDCPQLGPNHPNVAVSLVRIGFLLLQARQYHNAVITFEEALRIRLGHFGPTHGLVANLYNNLGVCHMHLMGFSVGRRYLQKALDIQKELFNEQDVSTTALLELADTLCNIGGLNLEWIRQEGPDARHALDAESAFLEALELRTKVLGEHHPLTNQVRSLHDMVRSIPLPKSAGLSRQGDAPSKTLQQESSPAGVSEMSFRSGASSPHTRRSVQKHSNNQQTPQTPKNGASDGLNLPSLSRTPTSTPDRSPRDDNSNSWRKMGSPATLNMTRPSAAIQNSSEKSVDYDATEEICLLRRPEDEHRASNQGSSLVVTYAQMTADRNGKPYKMETTRGAAMRQAKAILDAHRDFMESPDGANSSTDSTSSTRPMVGSIDEDGLLPLGGDWPETSSDRISTEVLQDPVTHLRIIHNFAVFCVQQERYSEAVQLFEMVVEVQKAKNGTVHEDVGNALQNVGVAYLRKKEYYHALQAFEEAVRVRKGSLGRDHPQVANSLVKVGISLLLLRRLQDSLWIFREALSVRKLALGSLHPSNARIYNNLGCVHVEFNELNEGRRSFEAALDIQRNALLNDAKNSQVIFGASTTLQNLGYLYAKRGMHEKAAMVLRESLGLQEQILNEDHQTVLATLESLGEACLDARRFTHALKYYKDLLDRSQSNEYVSKMKQAKILRKLAIIHEHQENPKGQKEKLELALQCLRSESKEDDKEERETFLSKLQDELRLVKDEIEKKDDSWVY